jgi:uncharacterized membrane protein YheB (UPF0754 family)
MDRLEYVYREYQQRHLYERLDEIATRMEETLLQAAIARELFNAEISVNDSAQSEVEKMRAALEEMTEDAREAESPVTENRLDNVEEAINSEANRIETRIHKLRTQQVSTVIAMRRLNEELNLADDTRLKALSTLLDEWEWEAQLGESDDFASKREAAVDFARDMRQVLEEAQEEIGAGFGGEEIEELANTLLAGKPLTLDALDGHERDALAESKLGEYLTVSLG